MPNTNESINCCNGSVTINMDKEYYEKCIKLCGEEGDLLSPICIPCTGKIQQIVFPKNVDRNTVNVVFPPQGDCSVGRLLEVNVMLPELSPQRLVNVAVILKEEVKGEDSNEVRHSIIAQRITQIKVTSTGYANIPTFTFLIPELEHFKNERTFFVEVSYHYSGVSNWHIILNLK